MQKLLIVEDDIMLCGGIKAFLEGKGYEVDCAYTLTGARAALREPYQLMVLDINLPDGNGLEFCREVRQDGDIPVVFLTANDTEQDMIDGFVAGCDDYIAKPFSAEILYQRIMTVLRRSGREAAGELFCYRELSVDRNKRQVYREGTPVRLTATEYNLLELLIRNRGRVLTRQSILEDIWDCRENYVDENTLNVHIRRLRQKIERDAGHPEYIVTVFGVGYTFGE